MIKVLFKEESDFSEISYEELAEKMQLRYVKSLLFEEDKIFGKVLKQSRTVMRKKQLSIREKWLGIRFEKEILTSYEPKVSIRWIDEIFGYGVFAEEEIPAGAFIGEYTGLVRKRRRRGDRKNDYCFEYTIGDWVYNPFIIDAKDQGNFTRFINHSDNPNLESLSVYGNGVMHIIFIALKPINAGTQMHYHYGDIFWKKRRHQKKIN